MKRPSKVTNGMTCLRVREPEVRLALLRLAIARRWYRYGNCEKGVSAIDSILSRLPPPPRPWVCLLCVLGGAYRGAKDLAARKAGNAKGDKTMPQ